MIKPEILWNLFKSTEPEDALWLGQICVAIGRRDPEGLSRDQLRTYNMINRDNEWYDERCEKRKEQNAERQRKARERKEKGKADEPGAAEDARHAMSRVTSVTERDKRDKRDKRDVTDVTVTNACHALPTYLPTYLPTNLPSSIDESIDEMGAEPPSPPAPLLTAPPKSLFRPPKWEKVLAFIRNEDGTLPAGRKIPEAAARDWFDYRTTGNWRRDNGTAILNWKTDLLSNSAKMQRRNGDASPAAIARAEETTDALTEAAEQILKQRQMRNNRT